MKKRFIVVAAALACGGVAASVSLSAFAQASDAVAPARARQAQLGDPYVPPAARKPTAGTQTTGAALHAQVVRKLARQFGAADTQNTGSITQAQARAAGLGYVANHFRQIDSSGSGRVSFSDVQHYMQARSANQQ
ncbi:EF-hand domain-containing protein [Burkholderia anthina]|uniref:EF-hand domain-containing protein n=1 Tax=Burkholderia anthina TaxID=179879 RepID=UPI001589F42B|nr:EF-hand domain-containing protein [Burkholderia anthina]